MGVKFYARIPGSRLGQPNRKSRSPFSLKSLKMNRKVFAVVTMLAVAMVLVASPADAGGLFSGLFKRSCGGGLLKGGCAKTSPCCEPAPVCCEPAPVCCEPVAQPACCGGEVIMGEVYPEP